MPSPIRRWGRAAVAAALLLGMLPTTALAAANAEITVKPAISSCPIDTDGAGGSDKTPCVVDNTLDFLVVATNTGDATLTHVNLTVPVPPLSSEGSPVPDAVYDSNQPSSGLTCSTPKEGNPTLSCTIAELRAGQSVDVRLRFDPTDDPDEHPETATYESVISMTAKAATKSGQKQNFKETWGGENEEASVTFLLAAEDDENTTTYSDTNDYQEAQVTAPLIPGTKFFVFTELISRDDGDFCGGTAELLGTCFGDSVSVEVEYPNGDPVVFEECDPTNELERDAKCIRIDIAWANSAVHPLYQLTPQLMTVYHDGDEVPKCALGNDLAGACSEPARWLGDPLTGWIGVTIYTDRNGNWGAG